MKLKRLNPSIFKGVLLLVFLSLSACLSAQFVDLGQDPTSVRWRQIKTDDFQIIYPDFYEDNAQHIANLYAGLYRHANSLGVKAKKMSMIIRANGGISNGNAGWAPKKSELYTTPPQDPGEQWLEHLCVHEFRHVVQYDKVNQGLSKVLYYIFGEQYTMALIGIYLPMWFLEGDATVFETAVGKGGRGRSPEFLNEMKAQIMEKGPYYYYKAILGSYKDYIPGRYKLGYFMVGNSRVHYGDKIWQDVLTRVGRRPFGITPFSKSIRLSLEEKRDSLWNTPEFQSLFINPDSVKQANNNRDKIRTLYRDNFCELREIWKAETENIPHLFDTIPTQNKVYASYHYPQPSEEGGIIAYKEGLAEPGAFIELNEKKEKVLFRPGALYDYKFAYQEGTLLWSEYKPHPRWEHGGKMTLASYRTANGIYQRYPADINRFSPFAAAGNWGFVEVDPENRASIVIMDAGLEQEIFRLQAEPGELFIHPSFNGNGEIITVILSPEGKWLEAIRTGDGKRTPLTEKTDYEIDNPVNWNDKLFYRASFDGNNAIYLSGQHGSFGSHLFEARYGVRYPALSSDRSRLLFSFYTADGYKPGSVPLAKLREKPVTFHTFPLAEKLTEMEDWNFTPPEKDSVYTSREYRKAAHLFNIHSWGPIFPDREDVNIEPGLAVSSQNKLSTLYWTAGYVWDLKDREPGWKLNATYKGIWPVFQIEFRDNRYDFKRMYGDVPHLPSGKKDTILISNRARYTRLKTIVQFPVTLNRSNYFRSIVPYVKYEMQSIRRIRVRNFYSVENWSLGQWREANPSEYRFPNPTALIQVMQYGLRFSHQTRRSIRDINPRWGQWLEFGYQHTPFKKTDLGHTWWAEGGFHFPGIARHHSFYSYLGHQEKSFKEHYGNQIYSPRGTKLEGQQISTLQTDYTFPIAYPDCHLRSLLYIKRISATFFFDAGREKRNLYIEHPNSTIVLKGKPVHFHSYGLETTMDSHFFTLTFPVNWGFRLGYETKSTPARKTDRLFFELLFSVGLTI